MSMTAGGRTLFLALATAASTIPLTVGHANAKSVEAMLAISEIKVRGQDGLVAKPDLAEALRIQDRGFEELRELPRSPNVKGAWVEEM